MTSTDTAASGPAPTAPSRGVPLRRIGRPRRPAHLVTGVLLVLTCVTGTVWWTTSTEHRVPMLVTATPVALGHVLEAADLRVADIAIAPGVAGIEAGQLPGVLGRPMATSLGAGALVAPDALGRPLIPAEGRAVVAVAVKPGQFPPELTSGSPVSVIVTTATTTDAAAGATAGAGTAWEAIVLSIAPAGTDQSVVSLDLPTTAASQLAQIPPGQLALVMQPAGGDR